jgi:hypothetical protein
MKNVYSLSSVSRQSVILPLIAASCLYSSLALAQTVRVLGEVQSKTETSLVIKQDQGEPVTVNVGPSTTYQKIAPGETDLSKAATITLNEVQTGDRVRARLTASGAPAASIIVISKTDLTRKQEQEKADWARRGVTATVTSVDAAKGEIQAATRVMGQRTPIVIATTGSTQYRRYAPESVRFADAKPSSLAEIKPGDQIRVLGNREQDRMQAEVVVSGTFRNLAGTVISVDAPKNEIRLKNLEGNKPITIVVGPDTTLRQLPERMASMMAMSSQGGSGGPGGPGGFRQGGPSGPGVGPAGERPDGPGPGGPGRGPGGPGGGPGMGGGMGRPGGGRGDLAQMLERLPAFTLADLKAGDALIVASTAGDPNRATAITILSGVEPLLTAPPSADRPVGGTWNFDINIIP